MAEHHQQGDDGLPERYKPAVHNFNISASIEAPSIPQQGPYVREGLLRFDNTASGCTTNRDKPLPSDGLDIGLKGLMRDACRDRQAGRKGGAYSATVYKHVDGLTNSEVGAAQLFPKPPQDWKQVTLLTRSSNAQTSKKPSHATVMLAIPYVKTWCSFEVPEEEGLSWLDTMHTNTFHSKAANEGLSVASEDTAEVGSSFKDWFEGLTIGSELTAIHVCADDSPSRFKRAMSGIKAALHRP